MAARKTRRLATRRDRRKAKASGFRRLPQNPKKIGHHAYATSVSLKSGQPIETKGERKPRKPKEPLKDLAGEPPAMKLE